MARFYLAATVTQIPFGHYIEEWGKLAALLVLAVDVVRHGDEADALFPEKDFGVKACLQVVASDTRHIFRYDGSNIALFNLYYVTCR